MQFCSEIRENVMYDIPKKTLFYGYGCGGKGLSKSAEVVKRQYGILYFCLKSRYIISKSK